MVGGTDLTGSVPVSIQYARQSPADDPNIYTELPEIQFGPAPDPNLILATLEVESGKIVFVTGAPPAPSLPGTRRSILSP